MTWIKTIAGSEAEGELKEAYDAARGLYPREYGVRVEAAERFIKTEGDKSIMASHSLLPQTMFHAFATLGTLLSPDLPLSRSQQEMIATTVSALNACFY